MTLDNLITVKELSAHLKISIPTIYRKLSSGELKSIKVGKRTLFREQDIQEYLNCCEFGEYICNQKEVV